MARRRPRNIVATVPVATVPCGCASFIPQPQVAAPVGNVLEFSGTVSDSAFAAAITAAPSGPLTVRPVGGVGTFTVSPGDWIPTRQDVTVQGAILRDVGNYSTGQGVTTAGSGFILEDCTIHALYVTGADDWTVRRTNIAFNHVSYQTGDDAGGSVLEDCTNWAFEDCNFTGHIVDADPAQHTEALNIRAGVNGGLISGCTFDDGGSTAHIFFTWLGTTLGNEALYPQNICITSCDFTNCANGFFHTCLHPDLEPATSLNIRLDTTTCTFDATALWPMGNENGEWTAWNQACSQASDGVIEVSGSITATALNAQIAAAPAGALTVRPATGFAEFTVTGTNNYHIQRQNVTFENGVFPDIGDFFSDIGISSAASGFVLDNCTFHSIYVDGADDWIIRDCEAPFGGASLAGMQGGSILANCQNWQILNTNFTDCFFTDPPGGHYESINIRSGAQNGLISGCTFDNGGNTAHIFFTWYDTQSNQALWPANICVTNCAFTNCFNSNAAIDVVGLEYPIDSNPFNLRFDPNCTIDGSTANLSTRGLYETACSSAT